MYRKRVGIKKRIRPATRASRLRKRNNANNRLFRIPKCDNCKSPLDINSPKNDIRVGYEHGPRRHGCCIQFMKCCYGTNRRRGSHSILLDGRNDIVNQNIGQHYSVNNMICRYNSYLKNKNKITTGHKFGRIYSARFAPRISDITIDTSSSSDESNVDVGRISRPYRVLNLRGPSLTPTSSSSSIETNYFSKRKKMNKRVYRLGINVKPRGKSCKTATAVDTSSTESE